MLLESMSVWSLNVKWYTLRENKKKTKRNRKLTTMLFIQANNIIISKKCKNVKSKYLPFINYHLPFTIYHLPFTIYHLPFTIYHLPFTIRGLTIIPLDYYLSLTTITSFPWFLKRITYSRTSTTTSTSIKPGSISSISCNL